MGSHSHCALAARKAGIIAQDCLDFDTCTLVASDSDLLGDARLFLLCGQGFILNPANGGDRLRQEFLATDGCHAGLLYAAR